MCACELRLDDNACQTLFCRSGLRDTLARGFAELPVYRAFKAFLTVSVAAGYEPGGKEGGQEHSRVCPTRGRGAKGHGTPADGIFPDVRSPATMRLVQNSATLVASAFRGLLPHAAPHMTAWLELPKRLE